MARREHPGDYNTFRYDPRDRVANVAGLMFGEDWWPDQYDIPWYCGPEVAPLCYDAPADYQRLHLPNGFVPRYNFQRTAKMIKESTYQNRICTDISKPFRI